MKKLTSTFFAILGSLLAPASAFAADTLKLNGKDTWDFYVYGNGDALAQILTAVKLMIAPDHGGGSFRYLLMFLAIIGFVVLAVRAGFDPGKNFLKMFGFIFLIWAVMYGTTGARANVHVYDRMSGYSNVITGVPAIVALPASLVSQTGEWLTQQIEQNFTIPNSLKISGGGRYSLFTEVMSDMSKFVITDMDLSNSLKAYVGDCVVPAMALGKVSASDLARKEQLVEVLEAAASKPIMTRYYPMAANGSNGSCVHVPPDYNSGLGVLMSCQKAYDCVRADLDRYADALLTATNAQWESTGVMVPFEQAMSEAMAQAAASGGNNPLARYSRPQGVILQKALSAHLARDFRDAAVRTGNNELMTATAIAQAEQSQKSSWYTAAELFKNMMGYVYLVLQAFIFAVIPAIVIALMIPGLGGKIFTNYFQILVWLTLWTPMLAIVNFLITVFGGAQLRETLAVAGLSMESSAILTEYSNNLVIAAQFIGTMVPLITWGLVKGAMAFTEFVSHGIGSSFATQAGAQAATGNVSMGNMSMDNVTMNKYATTLSSAVGQQDVQAAFGAGKVTGKLIAGGTAQEVSGKDATPTVTHTETVNASSSYAGMTQEQIAAHRQAVSNMSRAYSEAKQVTDAYTQALQLLNSQSTGSSVAEKLSMQGQRQVAEQLAEVGRIADAMNSTANLQLAAGVKVGLPKGLGAVSPVNLEGKAEAAANWQRMHQRAMEVSRAISSTLNETAARAKESGTSASVGTSTTEGTGHSMDANLRHAIDTGLSKLESYQKSLSEIKSWVEQEQLQLSKVYQVSQTVAGDSGYQGLAVNVQPDIAAATAKLGVDGDAIHGQVGDVDAEVNTRLTGADSLLAAREAGVDAGFEAQKAKAPTEMRSLAADAVADGTRDLETKVEEREKAFETARTHNQQRQEDFNAGGAVISVAKDAAEGIGNLSGDAYDGIGDLVDLARTKIGL